VADTDDDDDESLFFFLEDDSVASDSMPIEMGFCSFDFCYVVFLY